jgi:uncharacterized membrane protein YedE/YeeE
VPLRVFPFRGFPVIKVHRTHVEGQRTVTDFTPLAGLTGGILIGLSAVLLMGGLGRVAGISSIFGSLLGRWQPENTWRLLFILGLLAGAVLTALLGGFDAQSMRFPGNPLTTVVGGLLVGLGTALGGGCTSGHGICGIARLSVRSMVSTAVFMFFAIATVYMMRHVIGA